MDRDRQVWKKLGVEKTVIVYIIYRLQILAVVVCDEHVNANLINSLYYDASPDKNKVQP